MAHQQLAILLLCLGATSGLRLRNDKTQYEKAGDLLAANGPTWGKAVGGKAAKCVPAGAKEQPKQLKADALSYEEHWNEFCPAWGGKTDPHTGLCKLAKTEFLDESVRSNDCYLANTMHKKVKKAVSSSVGFVPPGIDTGLNVMDSKMKEVSMKSTPAYFEGLLDQDKDGHASFEDFKKVCESVNAVDKKNPAKIREFVVSTFPFMENFAKEIVKVKVGNFKVNLADTMGWKFDQAVIDRQLTSTWGYLCSPCSKGHGYLWDPELFSKAGEVISAPPGQKIDTDLTPEQLEKALDYKHRTQMYANGYYCDANKQHQVLPDVSKECSAVMVPDPNSCK